MNNVVRQIALTLAPTVARVGAAVVAQRFLKPTHSPEERERVSRDAIEALDGLIARYRQSRLGAPQVQVETPRVERPGCTAADETGTVLYHLWGIAERDRDYGVLRTDPERLERAALGAQGMGDERLALQIREFGDKLGGVRDQEAARAAAEELKPLADEAWLLGRRCGMAGNVSPATRRFAEELARREKAGDITHDEAIGELKAQLEAL